MKTPHLSLDPVKYIVRGVSHVTIEWRGNDSWAICSESGLTLNRNGEWEPEPQPSSRTEEYIARNRYFGLAHATNALAEYLYERDKRDGLRHDKP